MNGSTNRQRNLPYRPFIRVLLFLWALACLSAVTPASAGEYWPGAQWRTATPESQGMRSKVLADMMELVLQKNYNIDSILVIRNGHVVLDTYNYTAPETIHNIFSCSKSVTSALIGIAIDKGAIQSTDQKLLDFFPEKTPQNPDDRKRDITLEHVLMMANGLDCRDSYLYGWKGLTQMERSRDWVQHMIDLPMREDPGTRFEYCNGGTFLLSAVLQKTTGKTALEFAKEHLFGPLGIEKMTWLENPNGITKGYSSLHLRPRDMARVGYLYLKNGRWKDRQVVPAEWVARSTRKYLPATMHPGYGYQWWVDGPDRYVAIGYGGQRIFVLKDKQMVVVFTSNLEGMESMTPDGLVKAFIVPSAASEKPLPEDLQATERLGQLSAFWQTATYAERGKWRKRREKTSGEPEINEVTNERFGFSVTLAPDLLVREPNPPPPFLFRIAGLTGFPIVSALAADIPPGLALEDSERFFLQKVSEFPEILDISVRTKKMIRLSDGTPANYFVTEANSSRAVNLVTACVTVYKKNTLIGVFATGLSGTPTKTLKEIVTSLALKP